MTGIARIECPHGWVAIDDSCFKVMKLNLTSFISPRSLCPNGGNPVETALQTAKGIRISLDHGPHIDMYVLNFLPLWLQRTQTARVLLLGYYTSISMGRSTEKSYIVIKLTPFRENIALSVLSPLTGMKTHSYGGSLYPILMTATHVFCKASRNLVLHSCESNQFQCDGGTCILEIYRCDGVVHCRDKSDEIDCRLFCNTGSGLAVNRSFCAEQCQKPIVCAMKNISSATRADAFPGVMCVTVRNTAWMVLMRNHAGCATRASGR